MLSASSPILRRQLATGKSSCQREGWRRVVAVSCHIHDLLTCSFYNSPSWQEPRSGVSRGGLGGASPFTNSRSNSYSSPRGGFAGSDSGSNRGSDWSSRAPNGNAGWDKPTTRSDRPTGDGYGYGAWRDGKHVVGQRNMRLEKELYGEADDPLKQHTGINFEKYEDIPVEATGAGVPECVTAFTSPPLDPVLLENIHYARYTTPTPVQKYSIPIIAASRDLLACAQVRTLQQFVVAILIILSTCSTVDWLWKDWWFLVPHPFCLIHRRPSCSARRRPFVP